MKNSHCDKFFPPHITTFVKIQAQFHKQSKKDKKYYKEFKQFCLQLYFSSSKRYKLLSNTFYLLISKTLQCSIENLKILSELHDYIFHVLKSIDNFNNVDKLCIMCMDEAALKANLTFNIHLDEVGFKDHEHGKLFLLVYNVILSCYYVARFISWK